MIYKCPGQDYRNIKAEIIPCPHCGYGVEMFSDEQGRRCAQCRNPVGRKALPSCIYWCKAAKDCIGAEKFHQLTQGR